MSAQIQIAIIGCGAMGEIHAQCLSHIEQAGIRAFCDADEARAQALCAKYNGVYATTDTEKVLRDELIDAVYICTHHDTHSTLAIRAAEDAQARDDGEAARTDTAGMLCGGECGREAWHHAHDRLQDALLSVGGVV